MDWNCNLTGRTKQLLLGLAPSTALYWFYSSSAFLLMILRLRPGGCSTELRRY